MSATSTPEKDNDGTKQIQIDESAVEADDQVSNSQDVEGESASDRAEVDDEEELAEDEQEEDEHETPFGILAKFSREFLDILSLPVDPLSDEDRKSKPLSVSPKPYHEVLRLLQVSLFKCNYIIEHVKNKLNMLVIKFFR